MAFVYRHRRPTFVQCLPFVVGGNWDARTWNSGLISLIISESNNGRVCLASDRDPRGGIIVPVPGCTLVEVEGRGVFGWPTDRMILLNASYEVSWRGK